MQPRSLVLIGLLLALPLTGCLDAYREYDEFPADEQYRNPGVFDGYYMNGGFGPYPAIIGTLRPAVRPELITLESEHRAYGAAADAASLTQIWDGEDGARVDIKMAIWRPDNYTRPTPIIVDAGPYYEQGDLTLENQTQSTPLLVQNMLPRGYTIVQLAVRGTGTSGGCMDLFGPEETADLDQALTWLGEQPWSNGRIGMIGVSYDGSTPWTAAGTGNPYLKTIVPISGLPDIYDLMLHNGSAETRAPLMHGPTVYWNFGFSKEFPGNVLGTQNIVTGLPELPVAAPGIGGANGRQSYQDRQNLICPEAYEGQVMGQVSTAEGSRNELASTYWTERDHRDDVLANYQGSVFLIHGLQDWNVDPHAAIPFNLALREKGLEVKEWYGQWHHQDPSSNCSPGAPGWAVTACRMDYGDVLARWFDKHLMGYPSVLNSDPASFENETLRDLLLDADDDQEAQLVALEAAYGDLLDTGPAIQVQDNLGFWRNADSYPPAAPKWLSLPLGGDGTIGSDAAGQVTLKAATAAQPTNAIQLVSEPFPDGVHISGLPQLKVPFTVDAQGGFLAAWLFDMDPNGLVRAPLVGEVPIAEGSDIVTWKPVGIPVVGHAQMNLRFHAGGEEPQPLVPGQRYVAQMEFEPLEVHIPEGHRIGLWLFQYPYPDHQASTTPSNVVVSFGQDAQLVLPTLDIDPRTVFPVPGVSFPNTTVIPQMYVHVPILTGASAPTSPDGSPSGPAAAADASPSSRASGLPKVPAVCVAPSGCAS